ACTSGNAATTLLPSSFIASRPGGRRGSLKWCVKFGVYRSSTMSWFDLFLNSSTNLRTTNLFFSVISAPFVVVAHAVPASSNMQTVIQRVFRVLAVFINILFVGRMLRPAAPEPCDRKTNDSPRHGRCTSPRRADLLDDQHADPRLVGSRDQRVHRHRG